MEPIREWEIVQPLYQAICTGTNNTNHHQLNNLILYNPFLYLSETVESFIIFAVTSELNCYNSMTLNEMDETTLEY